MPVYTYQCQHCGLRFESVARMDKATGKQRCQCGEQAERCVPESIGYHFEAKTEGLGPQNTGIADVDYEVDRIIANDAEGKWEQIEARDEYKRSIIRDYPGATSDDLSREPDGTYSVMPKDLKEGALRVRTVNNVAMQLLKRTRKSLSPSGR